MTQAAPLAPAAMPPLAPLEFPVQDVRRAPDVRALPVRPALRMLRAGMFAASALGTFAILWMLLDRFAPGGLNAVEITLAGLVALSFFWLVFGVMIALIGAVRLVARRPTRAPARLSHGLDTALVMPLYHEPAQQTLARAAAMLEALHRQPGAHEFTLYLLSDTRDPLLAAQEATAFAALRARLPQGTSVFYRRRAENTDAKTGNIADWLTHWGGAHEAMIVLDADSLMTAGAIRALCDALACDPSAGLIQSFPHLIGARTLFARAQAFANAVYGPAFAAGLAAFCGREGNFWGHNAIIRVRAFAQCAHMPKLGRKGRLILSHDFVEAGLLRRAGWAVRFLPEIGGSYEETPATLLEHIARDRRWCAGNLQHLRLMHWRGLHGISRFHMLHGAMGYLLSPIWLALVLIWALVGPSHEQSVIAFFSPDMPLRPSWPAMPGPGHFWLMVGVYGLLVVPRLLGVLALVISGLPMMRLGGGVRLAGSICLEMLISLAYAPILMVQNTRAVLAAVAGPSLRWLPALRTGQGPGLAGLMRAHWVETLLGLGLVAGFVTGMVSLWLIPIALPLVLAMPLSWLSGVAVSRGALTTPADVRAPHVARRAGAWQSQLVER